VSDEPTPAQEKLLETVRQRAERRRSARRLPGFARNFGQIGVLGWQIVVPALIGLAIGRWLDHRLASGIFWTAPLLILGTCLGGWSAWIWIKKQ
jgi:ATP synthase protein I